MNFKSLIISIACLAVVAVGSISLFMYWPAITGTINKNKYLTPEQGQKMYDNGYADGNRSEEEQLAQIEYYKNLTDEYYIQVGVLNNEINGLNGSVATNTQTINELKAQKSNLELQVENLQAIKTENDKSISELNSQISLLQTQANQVPELNSQITNLQAIASQLQLTNQINSDTITNLNTQIISLNNQIRDMSDLSQNASKQIAVLNNRISELQSSINYYESYISTLENGEKAVATYEVDGAVWKIEIINKGEITLPQYTSNSNLIFNGWTIDNGELLNNTYTINSNTKFTADITHKYSVEFMNNDEIYNTQNVVKNDFAVIPSDPTRDGYEFLGWSLNGIDVINNINSVEVTENTTYYAVYVKLHTVTFMNGDQVVATQTVRNGEYATAPINNPVKEDYVFDNWTVNGVDINLSSTPIFLDTVFVAKFHTWEVVCSEDIYCKAYKQINFPITRNYSDSETLVDINVDVSNKIRVKLKDIKCFEECKCTDITIADFLIIESENISSASMVSYLGDIVTIEFSVCSKDGKLLISAKTSREKTDWDFVITSFVIECVEILRL